MRGEEAKLKAKIKAHLNSIEAYWHMPVLGGYGKPSLDLICCIKGRYVAIEMKAPGKKPTARQEWIITHVNHAGGIAFWTDSFEVYLAMLGDHDLLP